MSAMQREAVLEQVRLALIELFELDGDAVTETAHLYQDLELDSNDADDLVVRLQKLTGKKMRPEEFKSVRTVGDVVDAVLPLLADA